jgi:hypothetical protein
VQLISFKIHREKQQEKILLRGANQINVRKMISALKNGKRTASSEAALVCLFCFHFPYQNKSRNRNLLMNLFLSLARIPFRKFFTPTPPRLGYLKKKFCYEIAIEIGIFLCSCSTGSDGSV